MSANCIQQSTDSNILKESFPGYCPRIPADAADEEAGAVTSPVSPVVRGRRLAAILHQLRTASGKTVEEVAVHLECSAAKVSRIENGLVGVRIQDARDLLDLYGITGSQRESILDLVRQARGR